MSTTKSDIRNWINNGIKQNATHLLVIVDEFDWEDYPVYVHLSQDTAPVATMRKHIDFYNNQSMQRVIEVYNLQHPIAPQLSEHRTWDL